MDGIYRDADGGNLEVITDPGQQVKTFFLGDLFGGERAADVSRVDGPVAKASQVHLVVARIAHHAVQVAVGIQAVLAQDDSGETTRGGVAGVLKVLLALQHEHIPPHLHFATPTPHIDWDSIGVSVVSEGRAWPRSARRRRAAVSAFGFSGTNAHLILEEAPEVEPAPTLKVDKRMSADAKD